MSEFEQILGEIVIPKTNNKCNLRLATYSNQAEHFVYQITTT